MSKDHSEYARSHPEFYQVNFRRLVHFAFVQILLIGACLGWIFYDHFNIPAIQYFATTSSGQLIEIQPYDY